FEQCAEYLALGFHKKGYEVIVYNSHNHPYKESTWNGVQIVHCYDPEDTLGTAGQFIYDLNCILDIRKRTDIDVIIQLGYTSSSVWGKLLKDKAAVITNMDGLEWLRTKYSKPVKKFLKGAEYLGVKFADHLIADSIGIQDYLKETYNAESTYIPYGAYNFTEPDPEVLKEFELTPYSYDLLIARLEPENSIETILAGKTESKDNRDFLVIGNHNTKYGEYLKSKFYGSNIKYLGAIYDTNKLNNLRYYSNIYFHGHTVGGTNPSLLEAMASHSLICANDNPFNKYILQENALYFTEASEVTQVLERDLKTDPKFQSMLDNNSDNIAKSYSWDIIVDQYAELCEKVFKLKKELI
ncbi:MAG: glycosyltransferase family 1 protein, partial [Sphingobacteriaceae bacterium]